MQLLRYWSQAWCVKYHQIEYRDKWRIGLVKELIDLNHGAELSEEWSAVELDMILELSNMIYLAVNFIIFIIGIRPL